MIRENWAFWIILLGFIGTVINIFLYAAGYKSNAAWDADLTERLIKMLLGITFGIIYAIALGWI